MKKPVATDSLYKQPMSTIRPFVFDREVTQVFDDMINRSVPGYQTMLEMIGILTKHYTTARSNLYDLGCSTGASSLAISVNTRVDDTCLILVDNARPMIEAANTLFAKHPNSKQKVQILCDDIMNIKMNNASLICLNLTLQFIPVDHRQTLINNCFSALNPGGALILTEKVTSKDTAQEALRSRLHSHYKQANGYSKLEISQKRTALEDTLIPDTDDIQIDRLHNAGFSQTEIFFHCLNFSGYLAVKPQVDPDHRDIDRHREDSQG